MTVDVLTFGCRLNIFESAVIRELAAGCPDTVVINTCAVTSEAERQGRQAIRRLARERPDARIVVTGCAVQIDPTTWRNLPNVDRVLGNEDKLKPESWHPGSGSAISDIMEVRETAGHLVTDFDGKARAFVQIQQGCDHRCTFCIIPFSRGPNRSVPIGSIVDQVRGLVATGFQEVVLTGVDIASFGHGLPGKPSLGQMVGRLLAAVPELPRLRLSSIDPGAIDDALWHILATEPRLMPHLHLSLQSGSDLILKRMRRRHSRAGALAVVNEARRIRPDIAIGADLIAGFPTETEELFKETLAFVQEAAVAYLHVFPYSERPGTPAARMPAVDKHVRRERAAILRAAGARQANQYLFSQIGKTVAVLMETRTVGHTEHFAPARLSAAAQPGRIVPAVVTRANGSELLLEAV